MQQSISIYRKNSCLGQEHKQIGGSNHFQPNLSTHLIIIMPNTNNILQQIKLSKTNKQEMRDAKYK